MEKGEAKKKNHEIYVFQNAEDKSLIKGILSAGPKYKHTFITFFLFLVKFAIN